METAGEELSRLRAENSCLKQLLASKDAQLASKDAQLTSKDAQLASIVASTAALLACKDELLVNRAEEVQRLKSLTTSAESRAASVSATPDELAAKRQRVYASSSNNSTGTAPLDRDELLDVVFSFVGGGDHLYTGGVSRNWRGGDHLYTVHRPVQRTLMANL
jgi:chromosome segregation ATPase